LFEPAPAQNKTIKNESHLFITLCHSKKLKEHIHLWVWGFFVKPEFFYQLHALIILLASNNQYVGCMDIPHGTSSRCRSPAERKVSLQYCKACLNLIFSSWEILK